jgi:hypothetical protein
VRYNITFSQSDSRFAYQGDMLVFAGRVMNAYGACPCLLFQQHVAMPQCPDRLSTERKDMIHTRLRNFSAALCAVCVLLIGNVGAQQQKTAPQKATVVSKSETRESNEEKLTLKNLPGAVQATIQRETRDSKIIGISRETDKGSTGYEIETMVKGHSRDMLIDDKGNLNEIEEEIALASLPANIQTEVKKSIGKARPVKLEAVCNGAKVLQSYAALLDKGGKRSEISLGLDGRLLPAAK